MTSEWQEHIGVGEPSRAFLRHKGTTRKRPVIVEEGPHRGTVGGHHTDHEDGRVDVNVLAPHVHLSTKVQEENK